jgi:adenosine deaminase CECR1
MKMRILIKKYFLAFLVISYCGFITVAQSQPMVDKKKHWFENFKAQATDKQLYQFLYNMPKGGDLHNHSSGSNFPTWWYELASNSEKNGGYTYYTRTQITLCHGYGTNEFGRSPQTLLFQNISHHSFKQLNECEKANYTELSQLTNLEKTAWQQSIWLDKPYEGRDEFFQTHWQRLNELTDNPFIAAEMLVRNMKAFGDEGLIYLESQFNVDNKKGPNGELYSREQALNILKERLQQPDAKATGVVVRLQYSLLRFLPNAEQVLMSMYEFVDQHRDLYVAINMVGREDNDKGHPLRFLSTLRELRKKYPAIKLSIHAGEVDEPNFHIRDTLLLGADRIGHGVNLLGDPQTTLQMRHGPYMIEVNLISNLLLNYIDKFEQHDFPEFLRTGIPVALSTDDRGMWHSNLTDEFFVAVKSYNLSWQEVVSLSENSLLYGFTDKTTKQKLLQRFNKNIKKFEKSFNKSSDKSLKNKAILNKFILRQFPSLRK